MAIEEPLINSVAMRVSSRAVAEERAVVADQVELVALVELDDQVAQEELEALVELVAQAAQVELGGLAEPANQADQVEPGDQVAPVNLAVQEASVELVAQAGLAVVVVPVVELVLSREAGPELDPVELARARVAVPPVRNRSVIAAHHHGQVPVPKRVADLAAVAAATMRDPAAIGVVAAWVAVE
jgi:hypothetical protein